KALNPSPERYPLHPPIDRLRLLCLAPDDLGPFEVELHFDYQAVLDSLLGPGDCLLATGVPNQQSKDELRKLDCNTTRTLGDVRPTESFAARQQERLLGILREADLRQVRVLVLPELCLDPKHVKAIQGWLPQAEHLRLIVAGSVHVQIQDGVWANHCTAVFREDQRTIEHEKFNPFFYKCPQTGRVYREALPAGTSPRVRI